MTPLKRALDLSYPAFANLHQHTLLWPPASARLRSYSGRSPHNPSSRDSRSCPGDIFQGSAGDGAVARGPPELLGFDDRTMMYEGDAKDWENVGLGVFQR